MLVKCVSRSAAGEIRATDVSPPCDAGAHKALKCPCVILQHACCIFVEGIIWIGILHNMKRMLHT